MKRIEISRNFYKQAMSFIIFTLVALMVALSGCSVQASGAETAERTTETAASRNSSSALAAIAIDINPSVELTIDAAGVVFEATAVNEDAASLDLASLIGLSADAAVEAVILAATEAGFITAEDVTEDFVVVSTVQLDETADAAILDAIESKIQNRIHANADLETIDLTVQSASIQSRNQAYLDDVPLGLFLLNQLAEAAGYEAATSVKEFFANPELMALVDDEELLAKIALQQEIHETMEPGQGAENAGGANASGAAAGEGGGPGSGAGAGEPTGEPTGEPIGTGEGAGGVNRGSGKGQGQGVSNE